MTKQTWIATCPHCFWFAAASSEQNAADNKQHHIQSAHLNG